MVGTCNKTNSGMRDSKLRINMRVKRDCTQCAMYELTSEGNLIQY